MKQFPVLTPKRLDEITQKVIHNVIKSQIDTVEQRLLVKCLNLVRIIQIAPKTNQGYNINLPTKIIDPLSQELQEYAEFLSASDNDVDTKELTDQNQNFRAERQP